MISSFSLDIFPSCSTPSLKRILTQTNNKLNILLSGYHEINCSFLNLEKEFNVGKFDWNKDFKANAGTFLHIYADNPNDYFTLNSFVLSEFYQISMSHDETLEWMLKELLEANNQSNIPNFEQKYNAIIENDIVLQIEHNRKTSSLITFYSLIFAIELGKTCDGIFGPACLIGDNQMQFPCSTDELWLKLTRDKEFEELIRKIEEETGENNLLIKCKIS